MLIINFEQVCGHAVNVLYSLGIFNTYPQIKSNKNNWVPSLFQNNAQKIKFSCGFGHIYWRNP